MNFPYKLWRKYLTDVLDSNEAQEVHSYGDVKGDIELRIQLKEYLYHSRGVNCQPEQIIICSGTQPALEMIIKVFPYVKKQVAMEEPCDTNTKYESIIISGTARLVNNINEKENILNVIVEKYTPYLAGKELPMNMVKGTAVIQIDISNFIIKARGPLGA